MSLNSSCLLAVCLFAVLTVINAQFNFPCPSPAASGALCISQSDFGHYHPQYPMEWLYATGTLCEVDFEDLFGGCRHPIGYQLTEWLSNTTVNNENIIAAAVQIAVSSDTRYEIGVEGLPIVGLLNSFNLAFVSTSALASFSILRGTPGDVGAIYFFSGTAPNASIELTLRADSPLLYDGFGGYAPTLQGTGPAGFCTSYFYFSVPRLSTIGTITVNGVTKLVRGTSWLDHQWGANPFALQALPNNPHHGWIWMGLHLGTESILVFIPRTSQQNLLSLSWINIQAADGTQTNATVTSVTVLNTWVSPHSNITYPISLSFQTDLPAIEQILLTPLWQDQESDELNSFYWEGYVSVSVQAGPNTGARGSGYLELVGFTP